MVTRAACPIKLSTEQTNTLAIVLGSLLSVLAVLAAAVLIVLFKIKSRKTVPLVEIVGSQDVTRLDISSLSVHVQTIKLDTEFAEYLEHEQ